MANDVQNDFYNKLIGLGMNEQEALSASILMKNFALKRPVSPERFKNWYDKIVVTNKPQSQVGAVMQNALHQSANVAGVNSNNEIANAKKEWEEKGTDSKYFKKWFGDSKVVDENGKPLVVYHGTNAKFDTFSYDKIGTNGTVEGVGFYFTDDADTAAGYKKQNGEVKECYLSIQKPLRHNSHYLSFEDVKNIIQKAAELQSEEYEEDLKDSFVSNYADTYSMDFEDAVEEAAYMIYTEDKTDTDILGEIAYATNSEFANRATTLITGYDGVITNGYGDLGKGGGNFYIPFNPEQIKSVDNKGTFDRSNPNIYYQNAGTNYQEQLQDVKNNLEYKKFVNKVLTGNLSQQEKRKLFRIGKTPAKLIEAGLPDNTISIGYKVIEKAQNNKNADHNLSKETISKVWEALKNPIAVIKAEQNKNEKKENNRYSAILDLKDDNGKFVLVAIEADKYAGQFVVNDIRSIHSRQSYEPIIDKALNDKRLLKVDAEKIKNLLTSQQSDLISDGAASSKKDLPLTSSDIISEGAASLIQKLQQKLEDVKYFQSAPGAIEETIQDKFGCSVEELTENIKQDIISTLSDYDVSDSEFSIQDIKLYGSYSKGTNKATSDLDFIVQYDGSMREDSAFNILHDVEHTIEDKDGNKVLIDINPINVNESGTIDEHVEYMNSLDDDNNTYFQSANVAGVKTDNEIADAKKEWKEKGTDSKYFKKWFGKSKVVNLFKKPLIVYHGTPRNTAGFEIFKGSNKYYFSTTQDYANIFAEDIGTNDGFEGQVYPVYLSIQNPLNLTKFKNSNITPDEFIAFMKSKGISLSKETIAEINILKDADYTPIFRYTRLLNDADIKGIKQQGYDGIVQLESNEYKTKYGGIRKIEDKAFVAFNSEQIKSVDNEGTFDENNPNIYYQSANNNAVDLTDDFDRTPTLEDVKNYINEIVENGTKFATLSPDWFVDVKGGSKKKDHIIKSSNFKNMNKAEKRRHNKYVMSLEKLLANAEYIGEKENTKQDKKPNVEKYHYFKTNVKIGNKTYQIIFDTEEYKNDKSSSSANVLRSVKNLNEDTNSITDSSENFNPKTVHLYNIAEYKGNTYYQSDSEDVIREKLSNENIQNKIDELSQRIEKLAEEESELDNTPIIEAMLVDIERLENFMAGDNSNLDIIKKIMGVNEKKGVDLSQAIGKYKARKEQEIQNYRGYFVESDKVNILGIGQMSDSSTIIHELGHLFLNGMNEFAKYDEVSKRQLDAINNWLGYNGVAYTRAQHEKFAASFEAYSLVNILLK